MVHEFRYRHYWTFSGPNHASCRRPEDPPSDPTTGRDAHEDQVSIDVSCNAHDFCRRVTAHDACMNLRDVREFVEIVSCNLRHASRASNL